MAGLMRMSETLKFKYSRLTVPSTFMLKGAEFFNLTATTPFVETLPLTPMLGLDDKT